MLLYTQSEGNTEYRKIHKISCVPIAVIIMYVLHSLKRQDQSPLTFSDTKWHLQLKICWFKNNFLAIRMFAMDVSNNYGDEASL